MRSSLTLIFLGILLIAAAVFSAFLYACEDDWCMWFNWQKAAQVTNFEECVARGFPVMESYPRQCRAGDTTFTEIITPAPTPTSYENVRVSNLTPGAVIQSPLSLRGEARGTWFFEGSFPIEVRDESGTRLGIGIAQAEGEWMTTEFVQFTAEVAFTRASTDIGTIVLLKDNPSGLPEHDDEVQIPIQFARNAGRRSGSGIEGRVLLGPTCPVVEAGKEKECEAKPYATTLRISAVNGPFFTLLQTEEDGSFSLPLAPGTYRIEKGPSRDNLSLLKPVEVTVKKDAFVKIDIIFDSGIR